MYAYTGSMFVCMHLSWCTAPFVEHAEGKCKVEAWIHVCLCTCLVADRRVLLQPQTALQVKYTRARAHTRKHARTHAHARARTRTHARAHTRAHAPSRTHARAPTRTHPHHTCSQVALRRNLHAAARRIAAPDDWGRGHARGWRGLLGCYVPLRWT